MTTEAETKKPRASKEKAALIKTVEGLGISAEGLSDSELLKKVVEELSKTNDKLVTKMVATEEELLKRYVNGVEHNIKDQALLSRLMSMSVPSFYLHLYRDEDMVLNDKEIWSIVNNSGINPYVDAQDLFKPVKSLAPAVNLHRRRG